MLPLSIGHVSREKKRKPKSDILISYYMFENHILLNIVRMLEAAIEKCSKEQVTIKNLFNTLYI